jgi:hypothetical protein
MNLGNHAKAREMIGLVFLHPQKAVDAGRNIAGFAGDGMNVIGTKQSGEFRNFTLGAFIQPQGAGADGLTRFIERNKALALVRHGNRGNPIGTDLINDSPKARGSRRPPVLGILLEMAGVRI